MATVISVHGTFAKSGPEAQAEPHDEPHWWQAGSAFEKHIRQFVVSDDGKGVSFQTFCWSGHNSELARRRAGIELLSEFRKLEERGEKYCVIGHSHGGSVIASALMESVAENVELKGLQRWISVGTPFITFRKERFLFSRLPIYLKALFVAFLMSAAIFTVYAIGEIYSGRKQLDNPAHLWRLFVPAVLSALPFWAFYFYSWSRVSKRLRLYHPHTLQMVRDRFEDKWLSLSHEDDEALQGLKTVSSAKINIFSRNFLVGGLNLFSLAILPLVFGMLILSPALMTGFVEFLKSARYGVDELSASGRSYGEKNRISRELSAGVRVTKKLRAAAQQIDSQLEHGKFEGAGAKDLRVQRTKLQQDLERANRKVARSREYHRNVGRAPSVADKLTLADHRALRFKRRFLENDGVPCQGDKLCFGGRDVGLNAGVLFHLLTDEFSSMVVSDDARTSALHNYVLSALPNIIMQIVLVPIGFALVAVGLVLLGRQIAFGVSWCASHLFDHITWNQIRRSALGNDTESEVALSASRNPIWVPLPARRHLPPDVSNRITEHSNDELNKSVVTLREAISDLAFSNVQEVEAVAKGLQSKMDVVSKYLSWQELIHTSYFAVDEFRDLVAVAISELDGFAPVPELRSDPQLGVVVGWLDTVKSREEAGEDLQLRKKVSE